MKPEEIKKELKHLHILITKDQKTNLELISFYSGKSISQIIRELLADLHAEGMTKQ